MSVLTPPIAVTAAATTFADLAGPAALHLVCAWCGAPATAADSGTGPLCRGCLAEQVEQRAEWYEQCAERSRRTAELFDAKARLRRVAPSAGDWFGNTAISNRAAAAVFTAKATVLRERAGNLRGPQLAVV